MVVVAVAPGAPLVIKRINIFLLKLLEIILDKKYTMSSCLRSSVVARSLPAAPGFVAASFDNGKFDQPFPWRFNKRTQEIDLEFVDGFTNSTALSSIDFFFRGQQFGALHLVLGLGPNFIE